ncbi:hypothetical protein [Paucibacter sp. KBW04]|nr:hypothetical protein [Paucibacter sp. KBW04]
MAALDAWATLPFSGNGQFLKNIRAASAAITDIAGLAISDKTAIEL